MRKTLKMLLAATLLAAAAGCGSDTDAEPSPSQSGANHAEASETKSANAATSKNEAEEQPSTTGKDAPGVVRSTPSGQPYVPAIHERPASGVPVPKISDDTRKNTAAGGWLIPGEYEGNSAAATQKKNEEVHQVYEVRVQTKE